jgi:pyruvate dehydrogenase E1 component beta subunit
MSAKTYRQALAEAMQEGLENNPSAIIIGQGATDFKAIFGTVTGLAEKFPARVVETPIA